MYQKKEEKKIIASSNKYSPPFNFNPHIVSPKISTALQA